MRHAGRWRPPQDPMAAPHSLTTAPILPTLWRLSVPNMFAMVATALVSVAETVYVGLLGTPALAGMALVFPLIMLQQMLSAGSIGGGISAAVSRAIGAGQQARADALALHAVIISAVLGLFFSALILLWGRPLFALIGGQGEALEQSLAYAHIAFAGALSIWLANALASVIRGAGNMKTPSLTLLCVALGQIILGGLLGLGWGPVPRLGMAGIALGQVIAFSLGTLYLYRHLRSGQGRVRLVFATRLLQRGHFYDILKVGAVASISSLQTVLTILIITRIVAGYGTEALAGYGIGARLEFLLIPVTFAIGVACLPLVGMALGSGLVARARRVAWTGAGLAAAIVGGIGLLVALFPDVWARLFTEQPQVIAYAGSYFRWVAPAYGFFAFGLCLYFAAQGAGKLLGPVLAGTLRLLLVAVGGWLLVHCAVPVEGMFALISAAMLLYGLVTALAVYYVSWGD
ncbi:MAG: MATE family efflux transporter [Burkholderiales bacterium]|nr:MATE family efflux transporter [Burkholderiales bacterium]